MASCEIAIDEGPMCKIFLRVFFFGFLCQSLLRHCSIHGYHRAILLAWQHMTTSSVCKLVASTLRGNGLVPQSRVWLAEETPAVSFSSRCLLKNDDTNLQLGVKLPVLWLKFRFYERYIIIASKEKGMNVQLYAVTQESSQAGLSYFLSPAVHQQCSGRSWLVPLANTITMIKSRGKKWARHVARRGRREMPPGFWWKEPEWKNPLRTLRHGWVCNV